jgi:cellobiose phosphorylase
LGRAERAMDYYLRINPSAREAISEVHKCEPYVYAQTIAGKESFTPGEAKNSWLSGTASYNYMAITQWILGIRPSYNGLAIQPVVPDSWNSFNVTRKFRGVEYTIQVTRKGPGNAVQLALNGTPVTGNVLPLPEPGIKQVEVQVTLG